VRIEILDHYPLMGFEDHFNELDRLLLSESTDYEKMRTTLHAIRQSNEFVRMMGPAQDRLYASIARGHRKALVHLEAGDSAAAAREAAKAIAWFHHRFQGNDPASMTQFPHIAQELRAVREIAARSEILREAIGKTMGNDIHDP
jgi:hypothetical protein